MTTEINYTLVRLFLETIPLYDGDKDMLEIFVSACDSFHDKYYSRTNAELNLFIYQAILGKLKGNALLIIGSRTELNTWPLIKDELRNTYGERLNLDNLEQILMICSLQKDETYHNFAKRLQIIRSKLALKLKTIPTVTMDAATKQIHLKQYTNLALKIFVRNLHKSLRDKIIALKPTDLESAMAMVLEDENFELFLQPQNFKQIVPKTNSLSRHPHPNAGQRPIQNYNHRQYSFPTRQFNPINNQIPHNQYFNRTQYPTNSQVFGRPTNVWQPRQGTSQNYSKPTPMSGVSTIPTNIPKNNATPMSTMTRNPNFTNRMRPQPFHYAENNLNLNLAESGNDIVYNETDTLETEYGASNSDGYHYNNENYDVAYNNLNVDNEYPVDDNFQEIQSQDFLRDTQQIITP